MIPENHNDLIASTREISSLLRKLNLITMDLEEIPDETVAPWNQAWVRRADFISLLPVRPCQLS
jgi:hypothetical protein